MNILKYNVDIRNHIYNTIEHLKIKTGFDKLLRNLYDSEDEDKRFLSYAVKHQHIHVLDWFLYRDKYPYIEDYYINTEISNDQENVITFSNNEDNQFKIINDIGIDTLIIEFDEDIDTTVNIRSNSPDLIMSCPITYKPSIFPSVKDMNDATELGNIRVLQWITQNKKILPFIQLNYPSPSGMDLACKNGFKNIIKWGILHGVLPSTTGMNFLCRNGRLDIIKLVYNTTNIVRSDPKVDHGFCYNPKIIKGGTACDHRIHTPNGYGMSKAAINGHIHVFEFGILYGILPENKNINSKGLSTMDIVAGNGHFKILKICAEYNLFPTAKGATEAHNHGFENIVVWCQNMGINRIKTFWFF